MTSPIRDWLAHMISRWSLFDDSRRQDVIYPGLATGETIYAIGDVHGRVDLLTTLHRRIDADLAARGATAPVEIYLGDLIDKGPRSAEVIDALIAREAVRRCVFIRGNHEEMLITLLQEGANLDLAARWLAFGGAATALSYGVTEVPRAGEPPGHAFITALRRAVPFEHERFLNFTMDSYLTEPYLFVHAGVRPGIALSAQVPADLRWIREDFLDHAGPFDHFVVHGHSPVPAIDFRTNRINLDTGAFATGRLSCLRLDRTGVASLA